MGDTRRFAERVDLARMEPRGDLSSTGYALVNRGHEHLVLQVQESESFTVTLDAGTYAVEWYSVSGREQVSAGEVEVESSNTKTSFCAPPTVAGSAVLHLRRLHD